MAGWLYLAPPALLQVGSGYAAKIVCSNVFIANRDPQEVLAVDVQAPGHPLLRLMRVDVDRRARRVDAALVGIIAPSTAVYDSQSGCHVAHGGHGPKPKGEVSAPPTQKEPDLLWPDGAKVESDETLAGVVSDRALTGSGMRAVVVVKDGRIVAERYGDGFSSDTPLLGWSMTKTVNAAIIGRLAREGRLDLNASHLFPQWEGDRRSAIRIADLLAMESGLAFNENYGTVADVTRMLFLEPDMARFAAGLPLEAEVGSRFSYSSGTSVLLARIWMDRIGNAAAAMAYPRQALFDPLGMTSAVLEADEAGTFVASSHMYASARDWARFGLLLADDGVWKGQRLLPEGFVVQMHAPNRTSGGRYSRMQTWLPAAEAGLPADAFILSGHDGQNVYVIPSMDLVILRMGLTPGTTAYDTLGLVKAVVERFEED
jgi:CubicO group peptidase (beta-lactamase class C family)